VKTKREESGLHDQNKYPCLELCLGDDGVTYEMYATPSSTSRLGSNGASFATVWVTAIGRFPINQHPP
jgi:hypothetical protein